MNKNPSLSHYSNSTRVLHWLSVLAITVAFVAMEIREDMARSHEWRPLVTQLHFWAGLTVLALLPFRLWLHASQPTPAIVPPPQAWAALAARATHVALYVALLAQPLLGLATAGADGKIVVLPLLGIALPPVMAASELWADRLEEIHGLLANGLLILIGLHVAAALWHHFGWRDNTLRRMLWASSRA